MAAALAPTKEGRFLLPGNNRKPADVLILHWSGGRDTALDVTVVNPLQVGMVAKAAKTPGYALGEAFRIKVRKAGEDCRRQGIAFVPLACESLGRWHEVTVTEVEKLASTLARQTGQEEGEARGQLWQKLSILLMKDNAALLCNIIPDQ